MRVRKATPRVLLSGLLWLTVLLNQPYAQSGIPRACPVMMKNGTRMEQIISYPSSIQSISCDHSHTAWLNPRRARLSDDTYTALYLGGRDMSECLYLSDFKFNIPPGSQIHGIELWIEGHTEGNPMLRPDKIRLTNANGMPMSANMAKTAEEEDWVNGSPGQDGIWHYGGKSENWGVFWTTEEVNSPAFGVSIRLATPMNTSANVFIDAVRIKIYFTPINRLCNDTSAAFIVQPLTNAYGYFWELPTGAFINSEDPNKNAISINSQDLAEGVHDICVRTMTMYGLSEPCCLSVLKEPCEQNAVGDRVWADINRNGIQDPGEPGISGIKVSLMNARKKKVLQSIVTDNDGRYLFEGIDFGLYYLSFELPAGMEFTTAGMGQDDALDSDVLGYYGAGTTRSFYLASGEIRTDIDAGIYPTCTAYAGDISVKHISAPCLADKDVFFTVEAPQSAIIPPGFTAKYLWVDRNGVINSMTDIPEFKIPGGGFWYAYYFVYQPTAGKPDYFDTGRIKTGTMLIDELADTLTDKHICASLSEEGAEILAKICSRVKGIVWSDDNEDGIRDAGESPVPDIDVSLLDENGVLLASDLTDSTGMYVFNYLVDGNYQIFIHLPPGYEATKPHSGGNPSVDSDIDSTGRSNVFNLSSKFNVINTVTIDAGILFPCTVYAGTMERVDLSAPCLRQGDTVTATIYPNQDAVIPPGYADIYLLVNAVSGIVIARSDQPLFEISLTGTFKIYRFVFQADPGRSKYFDPSRIVLKRTKIQEIENILTQENLCGDISDVAAEISIGQCGLISGAVWEDRNQNGIRDQAEPGIPQRIVRLLDGTKQSLEEQITDARGEYIFTDIPAGDYFIQVKGENDRFTQKDAGPDDRDSDVDSSGLSDKTIVQGDTHEVDAGLVLQCVVFAGTLKAIPLQDPCFVGSRVKLRAMPGNDAVIPPDYESFYFLVTAADKVIRKTASDPVFNVSESGVYDIYRLVAHPNPGNRGYVDINSLTLDSSTIDAIDTLIKDGYICADLSDGYAQFDVKKCGFIAGRVWHDLDRNGEQKNNEAGIEQVPVRLLDAVTGDTLDMVLTGNDGIFVFSALVAGKYRIAVEAPGGFVFSPKDAAPDASDSDVDAQGLTDEIVLGFGDRIIIAAGLYTPCPLKALPVELSMQNPSADCIDTLPIQLSSILTKDTVPNGMGRLFILTEGYHFIQDSSSEPVFSTRVPGTYQIWQIIWPDAPNGPGFYPLRNKIKSGMSLDSLVADLDAAYVCYRLDSSDHRVDLPRCGNLGNFVWLDNNLNGLQDLDEPGINGVRVLMMDSARHILEETVTGNDPLTGEKGYYNLRVTRTERCYIKFEGPQHLVFTTPYVNSDDRMDSDVNHANGFGTTQMFLLEAGTDRMDIDAGMIDPSLLPGSVGDYVWLDTDEDGIQDRFESGVNGIPVALYRADGHLMARDTTHNDALFNPGHYRFDSILSGTYYVVFEKPAIYQIARPYSGKDPAKNSKITGIRTEGATDNFVVGAGQKRMDIDGGLVQVASVGDHVWLDEDADGIQDSTELGLNGVLVYLYDKDSILVDSAWTQTDSLSGIRGYYLFERLIPGAYFVRIEIPDNLKFSPSDVGGNDALDSDISGTNGYGTSAIFHLSPGEHERDIDAGIYASSMLGSHVWVDVNGDGMRDSGEPGISGVTVNLYDSSGVMQANSITDARGIYWFESLEASKYYVQFEAPENYTFTKHMPDHSAMNSDVTHINGEGTTGIMELGPHTMLMHVDAGLVSRAQLAAYFISFDAYPAAGGVRLDWSVQEDGDITGFEVSRRGQEEEHFRTLQYIPFVKRAFAKADFTAEDATVLSGKRYEYRIRILLQDGSYDDSAIQAVLVPGAGKEYSVFPVPASQYIHIRILGERLGNTRVEIHSLDGRILLEELHEWNGASAWQLDIRDIPEGMFLMKIVDKSGYEMVPVIISR